MVIRSYIGIKCSIFWVLPVANAHHLRLELQKLQHEINWKTPTAQILFGSQPGNNSMNNLHFVTLIDFNPLIKPVANFLKKGYLSLSLRKCKVGDKKIEKYP